MIKKLLVLSALLVAGNSLAQSSNTCPCCTAYAPTNNPTFFGRVSVNGQIGVDDIDVQNNSDLTITAESTENWVRIVTGGFKVEDGNNTALFSVSGTTGVVTGNGAGISNIQPANIVGGFTGNVVVYVPKTLVFSNGVLTQVLPYP